MKLTHADFVQIERDLGRRQFKRFARMAWHVLEPATPLKWGWALDAVCDHLQAVSEGRPGFNRLYINIPPGMMKSTLVSVLWPAWEWIQWPHRRFLSTAHKQDLAVRDNMKCRRLIKSAWYQERWPLKLMEDNDQKLRFENDSTGFREAMAFTSLTGSRGDRLIIDDPLSVDNANSHAHLISAETTFLEAVPTRINDPEESAIVIIMQRLNERDTTGIIKRDKLPYIGLVLPMEFEEGSRCVTPIFTDPRTVDGELLFPERFSANAVVELKKMGTYAAAGQLQQRPAPRGGGIFKEEWWQWYYDLPTMQFRIIFVDTAQKTGEMNDYTVFQCWGLGYDGKLYLIDQLRGKWEAPALLKNARAFWNKHNAVEHNGVLRCMKVEDKVSGTGLIQQLADGDSEKGIPPIPVEGIPRDRDKISRAYDVTPRIEVGSVVLPASAPFIVDYKQEFSTFPNAAHDDMVDPTIDAIADMLGTPQTDYSKVL